MDKENKLFTKEEIRSLTNSCQSLVSWLTRVYVNVSYQQMNNIVNVITTYECLLAFLYAEVYRYGNIKDVLDTRNEIYAKYTLAASLVFSEPNEMSRTLSKLPSAWKNTIDMLEKSGLTYEKRPEEANRYIAYITDAAAKLEECEETQIIEK